MKLKWEIEFDREFNDACLERAESKTWNGIEDLSSIKDFIRKLLNKQENWEKIWDTHPAVRRNPKEFIRKLLIKYL